MHQLVELLKSKRSAKFMLYFNVIALILWLTLAIYTAMNKRSIWLTVFHMMFALLTIYSLIVVWNRYKAKK